MIDSSGNMPAGVEAGIATIAGGLAAELAGADAQAGATAASNETINNWLNHIIFLPGSQSEAQQLAQDQKNCSPSNSGACSAAQTLLNTSATRDETLAEACSTSSSFACLYQKTLAFAAGNDVESVGGITVATPTAPPTFAQPSIGAATLDNMLGDPLAGISGLVAYWIGGPNVNTNAYYASQSGSSFDGILAGLYGLSLPKAPVSVVSEGTGANSAAAATNSGSTTLGDILAPNGQQVGVVNSGAGANIRTVTPDQFGQIESQLMQGSTPVATPPGYSGTWYQMPDGTVFGVRTSASSGTTIDVIKSNNPILPPGFKVHQK